VGGSRAGPARLGVAGGADWEIGTSQGWVTEHLMHVVQQGRAERAARGRHRAVREEEEEWR
jgi:hypothetical protein